LLYRALSKLFSLPEEITAVTDAFTCYPPAIHLIQTDFKVKITHVKVKGFELLKGARFFFSLVRRISHLFFLIL